MSRPKAFIGLAAAVLLAASAPAVAKPPVAEPDYTITVDASATAKTISDSMYGVFFEDINFAADGGLYAELVRNRSFEFLPVDNRSYTGMTAWTPTSDGAGTGTASTVNDEARLNERNRTHLRLELTNPEGGRYGVTNSGYNTGIALAGRARYDFSVWARSDVAAGTPLSVTLHTAAGEPLA